MKTAISIPDDLFREAERLRKKLGISRSELCARAISQFVRERDDDRVRQQLRDFYQEHGHDQPLSGELEAAQIEAVGENDWADVAPRLGRRKAG